MKQYIKTNWLTLLALVVVFGILLYAITLGNKDVDLPEVFAEDEQCWITNIDDEGLGFSFPTDYCLQLKNQCQSSTHNLPCQWHSSDDLSIARCICEFWG